jgi:rubrerythrin
MDFLDQAKALEKSAIAFYEDLAKSSNTKEFSGIFLSLAREERNHYEILDAWQRQEQLPDLQIGILKLGDIKKTFEGLTGQFQVTSGEFFSRSQIFSLAIDLERKSINLYRVFLESSDPEIAVHRKILEQILAQEENHIRTIAALAGFLRHPGEWLENAEFYHLDEY